jgi:UDP-glucose 6-dehydrogenase
MYAETRKMQLIEEVLKVNNNDTLTALEIVLKKSKTSKAKKLSIYDFVGILTKKETSDMRKAIKESAETINADDWK